MKLQVYFIIATFLFVLSNGVTTESQTAIEVIPMKAIDSEYFSFVTLTEEDEDESYYIVDGESYSEDEAEDFSEDVQEDVEEIDEEWDEDEYVWDQEAVEENEDLDEYSEDVQEVDEADVDE